jgi:hypothetical protein
VAVVPAVFVVTLSAAVTGAVVAAIPTVIVVTAIGVVAGVGVLVERGVDRRSVRIALDAIIGPDLELAVVVPGVDVHRLTGREADLDTVIARDDLGAFG